MFTFNIPVKIHLRNLKIICWITSFLALPYIRKTKSQKYVPVLKNMFLYSRICSCIQEYIPCFQEYVPVFKNMFLYSRICSCIQEYIPCFQEYVPVVKNMFLYSRIYVPVFKNTFLVFKNTFLVFKNMFL